MRKLVENTVNRSKEPRYTKIDLKNTKNDLKKLRSNSTLKELFNLPVEYLNNDESCIVCKGEPEDFALIKHHVSYFPQVIAYVHYDCHNKIHDPDNPISTFIQFKEGDSRLFYEMKQHLYKTVGVL